MDKCKKRERNKNFTYEETEKFISLLESYVHIIENKKSDAMTWQEKSKAWKAIETEFNNSTTEAVRDAKQLKLKYEGLKKDIRKKARLIDYNAGYTNKDSPLTPLEKKVMDMMYCSEGGENHESDPLDVQWPNDEPDSDVPQEISMQPIKLEEPSSDTNTADYLKDIILEIPLENTMETSIKSCSTQEVGVPSTSTQVSQDIPETQQKNWAEWKPAFKLRKHPYSCKSKAKRPFDKLTEAKLEVVALQEKLIKVELKEKMLRKQMLIKEMQHKNDIYDLEKKHMLLKIEILQTELDNKKNL